MTSEPLVRSVEIVNSRGLHARAAARFVRLAEEFDAAITVEKDGASVSGTSIMGLMMFAAAPGWEVNLSANVAEVDNMNATAVPVNNDGTVVILSNQFNF